VYFLINKSNQIEVLSPCIQEKLLLMEIEDKIQAERNMKNINEDTGNFKRIYHEFDCLRSVVVETDKIKKIMKIDNQFTEDDQLIFSTGPSFKK
jgi:hypothetical protein